MTGDPICKGSIIIVPAQKAIKLVRILGEMPVVDSVHARGEAVAAELTKLRGFINI